MDYSSPENVKVTGRIILMDSYTVDVNNIKQERNRALADHHDRHNLIFIIPRPSDSESTWELSTQNINATVTDNFGNSGVVSIGMTFSGEDHYVLVNRQYTFLDD